MDERFVHRFSRSGPRESALAYLRGLIAPLQRKNGWTLAEKAGHAGPVRIHRMLSRIEWDADEALDDVRQHVVDHLGDPDAVLVVDDTGILRKGTRSAWVQWQYYRHRQTHGELPGGRLPRLCHRPRADTDRPASVSAHLLDG